MIGGALDKKKTLKFTDYIDDKKLKRFQIDRLFTRNSNNTIYLNDEEYTLVSFICLFLTLSQT